MDNRFPPPRGAPPGYMSRMYRSNLRPIILFGAFFAILWSLTSGISAYRNVSFYINAKLRVLVIIVGSIFMGIGVIESFGIFAVASQRLAPVRTFAYLSILVTLLIPAAYIIQTVLYYSFKDEIITLCSEINTGDTVYFTGFFGPVNGGVLSSSEAREWCNQQFSRGALSNIVALLVTTAVAALFLVLVFAYLRQLSDPTSVANVARVPVRNNFPARHYPYNPAPEFHNTEYAAPKGPPPNKADAFVAPPYSDPDSKPPQYEGGSFEGQFGDQKDPFRDGGSGGRSY